MANAEHLTILKAGVVVWNEWRQKSREGTRAAGEQVVADLRQANLREADLSRADLLQADLLQADLRGADLRGANLSGATLVSATLVRANLLQADLSETYLGNTVFSFTSLESVKGLSTCRHNGPSSLDYATLMASSPLPEIFLRGCGLSDAFIQYLPSFWNQPIQFYSCFISYSHADQPFARRLHDSLQGRGIRCWLDEKQLLPGDQIYDAVDQGIRLWDKILLCCSEASLCKSWWVDNEIQIALNKEQQIMKERGKKVLALIPLNLDGYLLSGQWQSGMRTQILGRLAADFTGWEKDNAKFEGQLERVVKALRADAGARQPIPRPRL